MHKFFTLAIIRELVRGDRVRCTFTWKNIVTSRVVGAALNVRTKEAHHRRLIWLLTELLADRLIWGNCRFIMRLWPQVDVVIFKHATFTVLMIGHKQMSRKRELTFRLRLRRNLLVIYWLRFVTMMVVHCGVIRQRVHSTCYNLLRT